MRICASLAKTKLQISRASIFSVHKCTRKNTREETQAKSAGRDSKIFPHRESPHNACSAIGRDPVSLCVLPAVVYRYRKRSSFPRTPGPSGIFAWSSHLFSRTEQYNDLSLIQANTFFKTVLKYYAQSELRGGRTQCTHHSSDVGFRDLFVG
jgi:hypothetical protein